MGHPPEEKIQYWNQQATSFDDAPDHGLSDPNIRLAWKRLLNHALPDQPATVLDLGCGTGSISLLVQELGHKVVGLDFSEEMIRRAASKSGGRLRSIDFRIMETSQPGFRPHAFDVLVRGHVLWQFDSIESTLMNWEALLVDGGRLILIEGNWDAEASLTQSKVINGLPYGMDLIFMESLPERPDLWGKEVDDDRFILVAEKKSGKEYVLDIL